MTNQQILDKVLKELSSGKKLTKGEEEVIKLTLQTVGLKIQDARTELVQRQFESRLLALKEGDE
jgi:hypothetical protein